MKVPVAKIQIMIDKSDGSLTVASVNEHRNQFALITHEKKIYETLSVAQIEIYNFEDIHE